MTAGRLTPTMLRPSAPKSASRVEGATKKLKTDLHPLCSEAGEIGQRSIAGVSLNPRSKPMLV